MLKDKIGEIIDKARFYQNKRDLPFDSMPLGIKGEVEIVAKKKGVVFYHDKGPNQVTYWARHAIMQMMRGKPLGQWGRKYNNLVDTLRQHAISRRDTTGWTGSNNLDGTLFSGQQYFSNQAPYSGVSMSGVEFPYFPTKVLLGTGVEFYDFTSMNTWAGGTAAAQTLIADQTAFEGYAGITAANANWYSSKLYNPLANRWRLQRGITVNDTAAGPITNTDNPTDYNLQDVANSINNPIANKQSFGVVGAIKSNIEIGTTRYINTAALDAQTLKTSVGLPSFVYFEDGNSNFRTSNGIASTGENLSSNKETQLTFFCSLPEQADQNVYYPYNGFYLKDIGLFNDSFVVNRDPTSGIYPADFVDNDGFNDSNPDTAGSLYTQNSTNDLVNSAFYKFPGGTMWARRRISPIYKDYDVSIEIKWTLTFTET